MEIDAEAKAEANALEESKEQMRSEDGDDKTEDGKDSEDTQHTLEDNVT